MNFTSKLPEFKDGMSFKCVYEIDDSVVVGDLRYVSEYNRMMLYKNGWWVGVIKDFEEKMKELNAVYIIAEKDSK